MGQQLKIDPALDTQSEPTYAYVTHFEVVLYSKWPVSEGQFATLAGLEREMERGDAVGNWGQEGASRPLSERDTRRALKQIGNDGYFFEADDD